MTPTNSLIRARLSITFWQGGCNADLGVRIRPRVIMFAVAIRVDTTSQKVTGGITMFQNPDTLQTKGGLKNVCPGARGMTF